MLHTSSLLSAGADSSVAIWNLESTSPYHPLSHSPRTSPSPLGILQTSFYPFDSLAFLTSGYDKNLHLHSSETLQTSASFDLGSTVYAHATSTVATHLLVACGTQHPAVRLVDLRSGAATHSLAGHQHGGVLAVSWHPREENLLVSGGADGGLRVWDVRRSASSLGVLDLEDSIGLGGYDGKGTGARGRARGRAHAGAVNGVVWSEDGRWLVSVGHDERMRVWDVWSGANTLVNFGPGLRNAQLVPLVPVLAPRGVTGCGREVVWYPNPKEVLGFELHTGRMVSRLKVAEGTGMQAGGGARNMVARTTSLGWRAHHVEMYSSHADGTIRCWRPRTWEDRVADEEEKEDSGSVEEEVERKRKRDELEQIVRDLSGKRVTFS